MTATVDVQRRSFTVEEYDAMAKAGILSEDDRVELLNGEIVEMSPIGSNHSGCVNRLTRLFSDQIDDRAILSVQNPMRLNAHSEPEPDLALLVPRDDFYAQGHPEPDDVLLVVEVAETSAEFDRQVKLPLYAEAGIPEVWLIDLAESRVETYRDPSASGYAQIQQRASGESLSPKSLPDVTISTAEIL